MEVYKLHFEHRVPATRIAELMKVDRNTINNDLKILYHKALNDYNPNDMSLEDILKKQLVRLEHRGIDWVTIFVMQRTYTVKSQLNA
ncbi:hypothetical protein BH18THE1_BH18THE1_10320 [soil metagenome]